VKCCAYTAGQLRTPVTFQRKLRIADGAGGFNETWETYATTKAHVRNLSGSERLAAGKVASETKVRVVCRYFSNIDTDDRVILAGRVHNITFINNVEFRNRWLEIDLNGGVAAG
jgi:SPP1 family predicted phage head-tail adaptor